jgi:hypothetical protein
MRNKIDPNTVPWGTPDVNGTVLEDIPLMIYNNCLCAVWQKGLDPELGVILYTIILEFIKKATVWYLIKSFSASP